MNSVAQGTLVMRVPAGRMVLKDGIVRPLLERGVLCLLRDVLMDELILRWTATDGMSEHQYVLPRGKVKANWVEKCTSGRVLLFDVDNGKHLHFFWMQSRSTDLDDTLIRRLHTVLERYNNYSFILQRPPEIQMSTFRKILKEVRNDMLVQDVDLPSLLTSSTLTAALQEDPEFYASRLEKHLPPSQAAAMAGDTHANLVGLMRDSQVQWAAAVFDVMLRHKPTHLYLCSLFLGGTRSTNVSVLTFITQIILMLWEEETKNM